MKEGRDAGLLREDEIAEPDRSRDHRTQRDQIAVRNERLHAPAADPETDREPFPEELPNQRQVNLALVEDFRRRTGVPGPRAGRTRLRGAREG